MQALPEYISPSTGSGLLTLKAGHWTEPLRPPTIVLRYSFLFLFSWGRQNIPKTCSDFF